MSFINSFQRLLANTARSRFDFIVHRRVWSNFTYYICFALLHAVEARCHKTTGLPRLVKMSLSLNGSVNYIERSIIYCTLMFSA